MCGGDSWKAVKSQFHGLEAEVLSRWFHPAVKPFKCKEAFRCLTPLKKESLPELLRSTAGH